MTFVTYKLCNKNENLRPTQSSEHSPVSLHEETGCLRVLVRALFKKQSFEHQMGIFVPLFQSYFNARLFWGTCIKISFIIPHREQVMLFMSAIHEY